jgi:hypothetical protein
MSLIRKNSLFSSIDQKLTAESTSRKDFELENIIISLGDFGYIGNFKIKNKNNKSCCVKVIAKCNASTAKVDKGLLNEKTYLTALKDKQDEKQFRTRKGGAFFKFLNNTHFDFSPCGVFNNLNPYLTME